MQTRWKEFIWLIIIICNLVKKCDTMLQIVECSSLNEQSEAGSVVGVYCFSAPEGRPCSTWRRMVRDSINQLSLLTIASGILMFFSRRGERGLSAPEAFNG